MKGNGVFLLLQIGLSQEVNHTCAGIKNQPCIFPFKYHGHKFDDCTTYNSVNGKAWCATKVDWAGNADCARGGCEDCNSSKCKETSPTETLIDCKPSKEDGIFCLNDDFDIPCQEDQDCPENYSNAEDIYDLEYYCYEQTRCVETKIYPKCELLENQDHPWCQECRECFLRSLDETGEFWSACEKETRTENCNTQRGDILWLPDCSSQLEAGPWCNRCRKCWEAELLEGERARCWKNQGCGPGDWGTWPSGLGLKTEECPSNFKKAPCYAAIAATPPKRISHTSGQSNLRFVSF